MSSMTNHRAWKLILSPLFLMSSLFSTPTSVAHDGEHKHPIRQVKPDEMYLPTPIPDRIVLTWAEDPRTSQAVTWRTSTEVSHGLAELAPATHGPEFQSAAIRIEAKTEYLKTDINEAHFHSVRFRDLQPNTRYAYRVAMGQIGASGFSSQPPMTALNHSRSSISEMLRTIFGRCGPVLSAKRSEMPRNRSS